LHGTGVISAQERQLNAPLPELSQSSSGLWPHSVGEAKDSIELSVQCNANKSVSFTKQGLDMSIGLRVKSSSVTATNQFAISFAFNALPCNRLDVADFSRGGVKFKSINTKEHENEGSFGVHAHSDAVGPSAKRSKKMTLELDYTDYGPTVLGFRVQKLQLKDGELSAELYVQGSYFGDDNEDEDKR
jgi:hypothetical protein